MVVNGKNITDSTDIAIFAKSMTKIQIFIVGLLPAILAFATGFVTSCVATPFVGMAVGAAVGASVGSLCSSYYFM